MTKSLLLRSMVIVIFVAIGACGPNGQGDQFKKASNCPEGSDRCYLPDMTTNEGGHEADPDCHPNITVCYPDSVPLPPGEPRCVGGCLDPDHDGDGTGHSVGTNSAGTSHSIGEDSESDGPDYAPVRGPIDSGSSGPGGDHPGGNPFSSVGRSLGDFAHGLSKGAGQVWHVIRSEFDGEAEERRREADQARAVYDEAQDLLSQIKAIQDQAASDQARLESATAGIEHFRRDWASDLGMQQLGDFRARYNHRTDAIIGKIPHPSPSEYEANTPSPDHPTREYIGKPNVDQGLRYADFADQQIDAHSEWDHRTERKEVVGAGREAFHQAEASYQSGNLNEGNQAVAIGTALVDFALSMTPTVGGYKDVVEAVTGHSLLTGESLGTWGRAAATVGAAVFIGSVIVAPEVLPVVGILGKVLRGGREGREAVAATEAAQAAERVVSSAKQYEVESSKLGEYLGRLREAQTTKGNFDLPSGTRNEAQFLGEAWVGPNAKKMPYNNQPGKFV
jgi:Pre-toxin TG